MENIERPLDLLNDLKGRKASITLKDKDTPLECTLIAFDIHINLVVKFKDSRYIFIRGENVVSIAPKNKRSLK